MQLGQQVADDLLSVGLVEQLVAGFGVSEIRHVVEAGLAVAFDKQVAE